MRTIELTRLRCAQGHGKPTQSETRRKMLQERLSQAQPNKASGIRNPDPYVASRQFGMPDRSTRNVWVALPIGGNLLSQVKSVCFEPNASFRMAAKVNYRKHARLEWTDLSKLTSGVSYRRGRPCFEGNLKDAVYAYFDLPLANRATALMRIDPQVALERKKVLRANDIEALRKRDDFPDD